MRGPAARAAAPPLPVPRTLADAAAAGIVVVLANFGAGFASSPRLLQLREAKLRGVRDALWRAGVGALVALAD
jgi:hypothetical protein